MCILPQVLIFRALECNEAPCSFAYETIPDVLLWGEKPIEQCKMTELKPYIAKHAIYNFFHKTIVHSISPVTRDYWSKV